MEVFQAFHNLSHPGSKASAKLIGQRYLWPAMNKNIVHWARNCVSCQRSKVSRHIHVQPSTFLELDQRFDHVHMDIVGPLPESESNRYCLTMIDRFSRWPEVIPIKDIIARTFFTLHAMDVQRKKRTQSESIIFKAMTQLIGSKRVRSTANNPASNGMIERLQRVLKTAIKCHESKQWVEVLAVIMLGLRTCFKEDLKASAGSGVHLW